MRTLHVGLRVRALEQSLAFYVALGYEVVGRVPETPIGMLTMLKLPDDPFVTIELVSDSRAGGPQGGGTLNHLVIQVASLDDTIARLATEGISADDTSPLGSDDDIRTTLITDPDGNQIELVQWPAGHPDGMTTADFAE